jgi:hypothetical protein
MNGFGRSSGHEADALEPLFPDDFSPDEMEFSREMRALFPIEDEVMPPLYVQTLMDDTFAAPITPSDERTLVTGVFSRLRVAREPLLAKLPALPSWPSLVETIAQVNSVSRSVLASAGMLVALMFMSVLLTGPAFAQGLQILLGHTGVQQVGGYPDTTQIGDVTDMRTGDTHATFTPYWLGTEAGGYRYQVAWTLKPEQWSKGPIVELQYARPNQNGADDILDIREFQISDRYSAVLQVVQAGAASEVQLDQTAGVFVDGAWLSQGYRTSWAYSGRSELIFEHNGIIFWVVGDPRSGMDQSHLIEMASRLTPAASLLRTMRGTSVQMMGSQLTGWLRNPSSGELYALVPAGTASQSSLDSLVLLRGRSNEAGRRRAN